MEPMRGPNRSSKAVDRGIGSMHHFVAMTRWDAREIVKTARDYALGEFAYHGADEGLNLDDTACPKKRTRYSVRN